MMEAAHLWDGGDASEFCRLHRPRLRRVLAQGKVGSALVIQPVNSTPIISDLAKFSIHGIPGTVARSGFTEPAAGICSQLRLGTDAMFAIPPGAALDVGSDLLFDYVPGRKSACRLRRATEVEGTAS